MQEVVVAVTCVWAGLGGREGGGGHYCGWWCTRGPVRRIRLLDEHREFLGGFLELGLHLETVLEAGRDCLGRPLGKAVLQLLEPLHVLLLSQVGLARRGAQLDAEVRRRT